MVPERQAMTRLAGVDIDAPPEIVLPIFLLVLLVVSAVAAWLVRKTATRLLSRGGGDRPNATPPPPLGIPIGGAVLVGGLLLVIPELALPGRIGRWLGAALEIAFVLACAIGLSRIVVTAVTEYAARNPAVRPALGVVRGIVRIAVAVLAAIMALEAVGVPVAPLLTTLGIGSLAVALALQETLANFFAGLHLLADRPVRPGDYIKMQEGAEGFVETIGWRSSRLRTSANNIVIVPNVKLSQAVLTNFHLPVSSVTMTVALTVASDSDADAVERLFNEELGRAIAEVPDLRDSGKAIVRLADVTDAGQVWHCILDVKDVDAQRQAGHEIRKRLLARLKRDRIALAVKEKVFLLPEGKQPPA
jgi:small-conductance mechanosensitive channel